MPCGEVLYRTQILEAEKSGMYPLGLARQADTIDTDADKTNATNSAAPLSTADPLPQTGLPVWAIVLISVASAGVLGTGGFFGWRLLKKLRVPKQ